MQRPPQDEAKEVLPSDVLGRNRVVHPRSGASQERNGAAWLNAGDLDGLGYGEPVGVAIIVLPDGGVALLAPLSQRLKASARDELRDTAHAAADSSIPEHDAIRFRPVGLAERDGLAVEVSKLESSLEIFKRLVLVGERLHQAAQFVGL